MDRINRASGRMNHEPRTTNHGLTLIELLIAISISVMLGGTVVLMMRTCLDAYLFSEEQALIQKTLDEVMEEISGESFKIYGIKDALEILEAREDVLSFVSLWIDDSHQVTKKGEKFILNRPFRLGANIPILEFRAQDKEGFSPSPISFIPHQETDKGKTKDMVIPSEPLPTGSQARIIFQPDPKDFPDVIIHLRWDAKENRLLRIYKNKREMIPKGTLKGFRLTGLKFQYFDNSNTEIPAPVPAHLLSAISAVRVTLNLETKGEPKAPQASIFISLRNASGFGKGIIIRQGLQMRIPDSEHIRTFGLGNIVGVKEGDIIQLKAQPKQGNAWRVTIELGIRDNLATIKKYTIEYPPGLTVYSETINLTCDLPFNLLIIGSNGRYDYDLDADIQNLVDVKGEVNLVVEKMTPQGAAIFVR